MDKIRNGNFTSSKIVALMSKGTAKGSIGKPAFGYVDEKNMERRLGRALENEVDAKALSWGKLCEPVAFNELGLEYILCSDVTLSHPSIEFWKGSPDALKSHDTVIDFKCPMTLKSFCQLVDPYIDDGKVVHEALTIEAVRENHKEGDKYFYQIVSNAIITGRKKGELIIYCPYQDQLEHIRELASSAGEMGENTKWVYYAPDEQLPYLIKGGHYKNINVIEFDILQRDIDALTERVLECGKLLAQGN